MLRLVCATTVVVISLNFTDVPFYLSILLATVLYLVAGGWKWLKLLSKIFKRDVSTIAGMIGGIYKIIKQKITNKLLRDMLYAKVKKHPNKLAFIDADTKNSLTFKEVEDLSHKIANVFYEAGYRKGDVVALFMENRIEYMPIWLGLSMIGVITSLINYNLRGDSLKHCIKVCNCKSIIFSEDTMESMEEIQNDLKIQAYSFDMLESTLECKSLDILMESFSCLPPPRSPDIKFFDILLYIYTSGTTGLPKAVIWSGIKNVYTALNWPSLVGITERDTMYCSLPLYHSNGMLMTNIVFFTGGTIVIKKKFSASQFMEDCCKYNVTAINYIGEICRYLLTQPRSIYDEINNVRLAIGNGLRASIWTEFKDRFKIEKIIEFYGSTEGTAYMHPNIEGRVGAVGYRPLLFPNKDLKIIKIEKDTGEILRDAKGIAVEAEFGEPGELVGRISKERKFEGYTNKEATEKKIGHDIFSQGDSAYLSGDILIKDEEGYYYFRDRTGDTFRWKGENVSTNEVEGLISKVTELTDVCVYGVQVPGTEGKAGMACIMDPDKKINIDDLPKAFDQLLPKYAQPQFLRVSEIVDVTGTFKFQKNKLKRESYIPREFGHQDTLYYFNKKEKKYLPLDDDVYQGIMSKSITF